MNKIYFIPVTLALLVVSFFGQGNGDFWGIKTAFGYGAGSSIATVSSVTYTVDDNNGTISNVPVGVAKATFLGNLTKDEVNQTWNSTAIANTVVSGNSLVVTAQDTTTTLTYVVTVNPGTPVITTVAGNGYINFAKKAAIHVVGTAQANSLVTVALSDGNPAHDKTGTQQLSGGATAYDVVINGTTAPALDDGVIGVGVVATNSLGGDSLSASTTATKDVVFPTVTKIGNDSADVTIAATATATLTFSKALSAAGKTAVQDALTIGADKVITYGWNGGNTVLTITGHATDTTTFVSDVMAEVTDVAGNSVSLLLIDSALTATQTAPDGSGDATVNNTTPEVVITNPTQATDITITSGTTAPQIDVSAFISGGTGVLPQITVTSNNASNVNLEIPASTTVTSADPTWNGVIAAPTVTTVTVPNVGTETNTTNLAIEVGFTGAKLSFDNAVRILLPGQAGKRAGYIRTGIAFTEITAICGADNQATGDALAADAECKIDAANGLDLVIWTKHFTSFASFTSSSGGSTGGGGGGTSIGSLNSFNNVPLSVSINGGEERTLSRTVTLTLNGGALAKKMAIANGDTFIGSIQEGYATSKQWTLTDGEAMKKVCVKFYDQNGYYSNVVCDDIAYGANTVFVATVTNPTNSNPSIMSKNITAIDQYLRLFNYGQFNAKIRQLQNELKKAGFMDQSVVLSNRYGEKTRAAVQKYQQSLVQIQPSKPLNQMTRDELISFLRQLLAQKYGIAI